jgi:hypothetical protein
MKNFIVITCFILSFSTLQGQTKDSMMVAGIIKEASVIQLQQLAHELTDMIGPRLVGTPQMKKAHDWAVAKYKAWGISAKNEKWGEWKGWERGISHIDMILPWVRSLEGTQLAWSPSTGGKNITGEVIIIADHPDSLSFDKWLPAVRGSSPPLTSGSRGSSLSSDFLSVSILSVSGFNFFPIRLKFIIIEAISTS